MKCPFCGHTEDRVVDSRVGRDGEFIRRRRECLKCHRRYTTYEYIEDVLPHVVKRDGRREPFDRQKVLRGLEIACRKRPVAMERLEQVADAIERELYDRGEHEVQAAAVGEMVMEALRGLDPVAYVRFASVYRHFRDIGEFMSELKDLLNAKD